MMTYSSSYSQSFTRTNAKYLASKIAANLKRIQRLYGSPSDTWIANLEQEAIEMLVAGYIDKITYGFKRDGKWIEPTLIYTVQDLSSIYSGTDDDPGDVRARANIKNASFYTFLQYSDSWETLSATEKNYFRQGLAIKRSPGQEPEIEGILKTDHIYSAGGKSLNRSSVQNY